MMLSWCFFFLLFKQKTAYEMRISDWSSDVCSSDLFYPDGRDACVALLESCLAGSRPCGGVAPKVVVAPHAGWAFSGPIAGTAYAALRPQAGSIRRVVLLGPAQRVVFRGIDTTGAEAWATPAGTVADGWEGLAGLEGKSTRLKHSP